MEVDTANTDSNLSTTGNPQDIGSQDLSASQTNLQTTYTQSSNAADYSITSVGDGEFTPFDSSSASTTANDQVASSVIASSSNNTGLALSIVALAVVASVLMGWLFLKDSKRNLLK